MSPHKKLLAAIGVFGVMACLGLAQTEPDEKLPPPPGKDLPAPPPAPGQNKDVRDPTTPGPKLKNALNTGKAKTPGGPALKTPVIILRARVLAQGVPPAAVLEVDGKVFTVAKDSTLIGTPYRVLDIGVAEIRIENSLSSEVIVIR